MRSLRFVSDSSPGIRRHKRRLRGGKFTFSYTTPRGKPLKDKATLEGLRRLRDPETVVRIRMGGLEKVG